MLAFWRDLRCAARWPCRSRRRRPSARAEVSEVEIEGRQGRQGMGFLLWYCSVVSTLDEVPEEGRQEQRCDGTSEMGQKHGRKSDQLVLSNGCSFGFWCVGAHGRDDHGLEERPHGREARGGDCAGPEVGWVVCCLAGFVKRGFGHPSVLAHCAPVARHRGFALRRASGHPLSVCLLLAMRW